MSIVVVDEEEWEFHHGRHENCCHFFTAAAAAAASKSSEIGGGGGSSHTATAHNRQASVSNVKWKMKLNTHNVISSFPTRSRLFSPILIFSMRRFDCIWRRPACLCVCVYVFVWFDPFTLSDSVRLCDTLHNGEGARIARDIEIRFNKNLVTLFLFSIRRSIPFCYGVFDSISFRCDGVVGGWSWSSGAILYTFLHCA